MDEINHDTMLLAARQLLIGQAKPFHGRVDAQIALHQMLGKGIGGQAVRPPVEMKEVDGAPRLHAAGALDEIEFRFERTVPDLMHGEAAEPHPENRAQEAQQQDQRHDRHRHQIGAATLPPLPVSQLFGWEADDGPIFEKTSVSCAETVLRMHAILDMAKLFVETLSVSRYRNNMMPKVLP